MPAKSAGKFLSSGACCLHREFENLVREKSAKLQQLSRRPCYVTVQDRNLRITRQTVFLRGFGFVGRTVSVYSIVRRLAGLPSSKPLKRKPSGGTVYTAAGEHYNTLIRTRRSRIEGTSDPCIEMSPTSR